MNLFLSSVMYLLSKKCHFQLKQLCVAPYDWVNGGSVGVFFAW